MAIVTTGQARHHLWNRYHWSIATNVIRGHSKGDHRAIGIGSVAATAGRVSQHRLHTTAYFCTFTMWEKEVIAP